MKFWERHEQEMRKNRLLQAAALMHKDGKSPFYAVDEALKLEAEINRRLENGK